MKVFITGATGFVGSRVLNQLLNRKHGVTAMVRKEADKATLTARGVNVFLGDLKSIDKIQNACRAADVVIHLAFNHELHEMADFMSSVNLDAAAIEAMSTALAEGTGKKLIVTSGVIVGGDTGSTLSPERPSRPHGRGNNEMLALKGVQQGIQVMVMRLPVYTYDDSAFASYMVNVHVQAAKKRGSVSYIDSGAQKLCAVHVNDAAAAYVAAAEIGPESGIYNVTAEHSLSSKELAEAVSKKLNKEEGKEYPLQSINAEEAKAVYTWMAFIFGMNLNYDSSKAKKDFRWEPTRTSGFLDVVAASG